MTEGWQPMINLSHLDEFVRQTPFKMETVASVLLSVREGDILASIDLNDAYFQIPVHQSLRKLLRDLSGGTVYQFKALCFGLSTAPQVFTKVFADVSVWTHSHGIRLLWYLDAWLVLASSEVGAKMNVQDLLSVCRSLGIVINKEKSDLIPSQTANYLGMTIDTGAARIFLSLEQVEKFLSLAEMFCTMTLPPRSALGGGFGSPGFAGEAGSSQLTSDTLSAVAFEDTLVPRGKFPSPPPPGAPVPRGEGEFVVVGGEGPPSQGGSIRDTHSRSTPVLGRVSVGVGRTLLRPGNVRGVVRAGEVAAHQSSRNEGIVSGIAVISGVGRRSPGDRDVRQLDGCGLHQQAGRDGFPFPCLLASQLLRWMESLNIHLNARYLPGQSNVLADLLSRWDQVIGTQWSLHRRVARDLLCCWGSPSIDLFATSYNVKHPLYCSLVPDPQAVFEGAFRHPWDNLYAFPPFPLVGRVVD